MHLRRQPVETPANALNTGFIPYVEIKPPTLQPRQPKSASDAEQLGW